MQNDKSSLNNVDGVLMITKNAADGKHVNNGIDGQKSIDEETHDLTYDVNQRPPVGLMVSIAFQHVLMTVGSMISTASVIADVICARPDHPIRAKLFCTTMFVSGLASVLQSSVGVRLPIYQGPSASFLVPLLAMQTTEHWKCDAKVSPDTNSTTNRTTSIAYSTDDELHDKLQQMMGSLIAAGAIEVVLGCTGLIGLLMRFIGPLTIAPVITLIGISLYRVPIVFGRTHWGLTALAAILVILFILYFNRIKVPMPVQCAPGRKKKFIYIPVFQTFPILLSMLLTWGVCGIMTVTNSLDADPSSLQYRARTDAKIDVVTSTPWLYIPHPGQFGAPKFSASIFVGFLAAVFASTLESMGDYLTAAMVCLEPRPPSHAMNRGIFMEGMAGVLGGFLGTGHATTSFTTNIALLKITKIASRSCLILAGFLAIFLSLVGKIGAVLSSLPDPAIGGTMFVNAGILTALGIFNLQFVDLKSSRNMAIFGVSLYIGIVIPEWVNRYPEGPQTGNVEIDGVVKAILGTPMFLGGVLAFVLDNTVKGTPKERGMTEEDNVQRQRPQITTVLESQQRKQKTYDIPFINGVLARCSCFGRLPFVQSSRTFSNYS